MLCCETCSAQRFPSSSSAAAITAAAPPQLTEPKGSASRCPSVTGVPQKPKAELDTAQNPGWRLTGPGSTILPSPPSLHPVVAGGTRKPRGNGGDRHDRPGGQSLPRAALTHRLAALQDGGRTQLTPPPPPHASPSPWQRGREPAREGAEPRPALAVLPGWLPAVTCRRADSGGGRAPGGYFR